MDRKGSLIDTNLRIYPSEKLKAYLESLTIDKDVPSNIVNFIKGKPFEVGNELKDYLKGINIDLTNEDYKTIRKIQEKFVDNEEKVNEVQKDDHEQSKSNDSELELTKIEENKFSDCPYLTTQDVDWLYAYLYKMRSNNKDIPYLHELMEGSHVETPENVILKRNPDLEARCVKLRAQQEAREYRKMTKGVDNVRIRYPEDSISYQLKQLNRQLIAIGQFLISIFAGFLFGFRGIELMIGDLDFGFRLLLGVMCALVIALAEIYFLAKKLNEELSMPETVQLGGPAKFADDADKLHAESAKEITNKQHQD